MSCSDDIGFKIHVVFIPAKNHFRIGRLKDISGMEATVRGVCIHTKLPQILAPVFENYAQHSVKMHGKKQPILTAGLTAEHPYPFPALPSVSQSSKDQKATKDEKIPKPRNSWIIYRADKHAEYKALYPEMHVSEMCKSHVSSCPSKMLTLSSQINRNSMEIRVERCQRPLYRIGCPRKG